MNRLASASGSAAFTNPAIRRSAPISFGDGEAAEIGLCRHGGERPPETG
jgi:hypothetical protein